MHRLKNIPVVFAVLFVALAWAMPCQALTVAEEKELGKKFMAYVRTHNQLIDDPVISPYVESIGRALLSELPPQPFKYEFFVVRQNAYNAFAGPGGHVFINSGLLEAMESEEELAGILAHEIAHVYFRHISDKISRGKKIQLASMAGMLASLFLGGGALTNAAVMASVAGGNSAYLAFSREDEAQADQGGLGNLRKAGYGTQGLLNMLTKIRQKRWFGPEEIPTYLTTHPALEERLMALDTFIAANPDKARATRSIPPYPFDKVRTRTLALYGDPGVAAMRMEEMLKKNPDDPAALYGQALLLAKNGHRKNALRQMEKALEFKPFDPDLLREMGVLRFEDGNNKRAIQALSASVKAQPETGAGWFWLGRVRMDNGDAKKAAEDLKTAHELNPHNPLFLHYLAQAMGRLNKLGHAHYYQGLHHFFSRDLRSAKFHLKKAQKHAQKDELLKKRINKALEKARETKPTAPPQEETKLIRDKGQGPLWLQVRR